MKVKINVTAKHIKRGWRFSACSCPVALAIKETLNKPYVVVVDFVRFTRLGGKAFPLPKKVHDFIDRFDDGKKVKPFSFYFPLQ